MFLKFNFYDKRSAMSLIFFTLINNKIFLIGGNKIAQIFLRIGKKIYAVFVQKSYKFVLYFKVSYTFSKNFKLNFTIFSLFCLFFP